MNASRLFTAASNGVARGAGSPMTFAACCLIVIVWAATAPMFGYSDTWQLVINTGTSVVTFLMVFLIQSTPEGRSMGASWVWRNDRCSATFRMSAKGPI
jgi:low affinity Fe/Cu permease